ncbi:antitoxin [Bathymodiolus japonicus methanotrophic gill symbiont]|nr:antitoxin [Bathymodiolus japonicus methanotrophic gill symbiont]
MQIIPLTGIHDRLEFDSGREDLNSWLQRVARQHQEKGLSKTFVATHEDIPNRIYGLLCINTCRG